MEGKISRLALRGWLLGSLAVLVFHGVLWEGLTRSRPLRLPETPADLTNPVYAKQWHFLMDARDWIPDGATYSVASGDLEREMSLFVLSLGVYPKAQGLPRTYFGVQLQDFPREARFILDEGCQLVDRSDFRVIARLPGGCVEVRR